MTEEQGDRLSRFDSLLDLAPDLISIMDSEGRYLGVSKSAARIHGYAPSELIGRYSAEFIHPGDRAAVSEAMVRAFADPGTTVSSRYRYRDKNGSWRWVDGSGSCISAEDGAMLLLVFSRDATRQVEAESTLGRALSEKDALLHEIQHRVKNSVALISSFVALEEGRTLDGPLRGVLENLRFRIDSISTLYRILFSSGEISRINLRNYLEKLVFDIAQTVDRPDVVTKLDLTDITLDTKRAVPLGILCTELVANALRHGFGQDGAGTLEVSLSSGEGRLGLVVADDGRGLPDGFELDSQQGLGLQIARMLALQLKGRLVAGGREGGGARFSFEMALEAVA